MPAAAEPGIWGNFWNNENPEFPKELLLLISVPTLVASASIFIYKIFIAYTKSNNNQRSQSNETIQSPNTNTATDGAEKPTNTGVNVLHIILMILGFVIVGLMSVVAYKNYTHAKDCIWCLVSTIFATVSMLLLSVMWLPCINRGSKASGFHFTTFVGVYVLNAALMLEILYKKEEFGSAHFIMPIIVVALSTLYSTLLCCFPCSYCSNNKIWAESSANLFSRVTFLYMYPEMWRGYFNGVSLLSVCTMNKENKAKNVTERIIHQWSSQRADFRNKSHWALWVFVFNSMRRQILTLIFIRFASVVISFLYPLLMKLLMDNLSNSTSTGTNWRDYITKSGLVVSFMIDSFAYNHFFQYGYRIQKQFVFGISRLIYTKSLEISASSRMNEDVIEKMLNFVSNDIHSVTTFFLYLPMLLVMPFELGVFIYLLYTYLSWAIFVGFGVMLFLILITGVLAVQSKKFTAKITTWQDKRIKAVTDLFNYIGVMRFYAWEPHFQQKIEHYRKQETNNLLKEGIFFNLMTNMWNFSSMAIMVVSFFTFLYGIYNKQDTSKKIPAGSFVAALYLLNFIRVPISLLPLMISSFILTLNTSKRIVSFLNLEERGDNKYLRYNDGSESCALKINNGCFKWTSDSPEVLHDLNITIGKKELIGVAGRVGSGKTSLMCSILGEMIPGSEKAESPIEILSEQSVAYVSQEAWIQSKSVRDNILFFKEFDRRLYDKVVKSSCLEADFENLVAADMTQIGQKGINLSGGQKQRIALARAVYAQKDLILLDDPLSAVDVHVGANIFKNCISNKGILKDTTRIFVSNNPVFLNECDKVLVLEEGRAVAFGHYNDIIADHDFIKNYQPNESVEDGSVADIDTTGGVASDKRQSFARGSHQMRAGTGESASYLRRLTKTDHMSMAKNTNVDIQLEDESEEEIVKKTQNFFTGEKISLGAVKLSVIYDYFRHYTNPVLVIMVLSFLVSVAFIVFGNYSLYKFIQVNSDKGTDKSIEYTWIWRYLFGSSLFLVFSAIFYTSITYGAYLSSKTIHNLVLDKIIHWPLSQFEKTPAGRILNRLSKDMWALDFNIPRNIHLVMLTFVGIISSYLEMAAIKPYLLVLVIFVSIITFFVQRVFVANSRQFGRLDTVSRGPSLNQFIESFQGGSIILAMGMEQQMKDQFIHLLDNQIQWWVPLFSTARWIGIALDLVGLITLIVTLILIEIIGMQDTSPGEKSVFKFTPIQVGYLLGRIKAISSVYVWFVRQIAEFETSIISNERILDLKRPNSEAPWFRSEVNDIRENWPTQGKVEFRNFSLRYRENLPLALANLNFTIKQGSKVGVVGRTGAGKSTLISALFRTIEPASGTIYIDDVDITTLGLLQLRQKLSLIPQDPMIFEDTLRNNLDPEGLSTDDNVWKYLAMCRMDTIFSKSENGLETRCTEDTFSVGQKQLLCLVRALLRRSKVLMLDEATASVDLQTDAMIQNMIKNEFADTTIITVAHRLHTIIDYDVIIVMDRGCVKEMDSPQELIRRRGIFFEMCKEANLAN